MSEFDGINELTDAERAEIRESTARRFRGLYDKFTVQRTDGTDGPGQKHDGCHYFVLDLKHDRHAAALLPDPAGTSPQHKDNTENDLTRAHRDTQASTDRNSRVQQNGDE